MKTVAIFLLAGALLFTQSPGLLAYEETGSEIEDVNLDTEELEDQGLVEVENYTHPFEEDGEAEDIPEELIHDQEEGETEYPDDRYVDDRG